MITKTVDPSEFGFDQAVMSLMEIHRGGIDSRWQTKRASVLNSEMASLRPEPGIMFVHMNAVGSSEWTGANRNGDLFPEAENIRHHGSFVKFARFYHNHKNKPALGDPDFGFVKYSAYNPEMHRIELVVGIREKDDPDTIEKLARDEDIEVSMACNIDHDECTNCGNKSNTPHGYCDCIKNHCGEMTKSGGVIGMVNIGPRYFDISRVPRGAERTARSFRKVAGDKGGLPYSVANAIEYGVTDPNSPEFIEKIGTWLALQSVAERMSRAPLITSLLNEPTPVQKQGSELTIADRIGSASRAGVVLGIEDFWGVMMGDRYAGVAEKVAEAKAYMPFVWRSRDEAEKVIACSTHYDNLPQGFSPDVRLNKYAMTQSAIMNRVMQTPVEKIAAAPVYTRDVSVLAKDFAREYAGYKLAYAHKNSNDFLLGMIVTQDGVVS